MKRMIKMFNVRMLLISVVAISVFTACQNDEVLDDQNGVGGKPGMLTFTIKNSELKTKAMQTTAYDPAAKDAERLINNFTVFVYNEDGVTLNVPPQYYTSFIDSNNDGTSDPIDIPITRAATYAVVVANLGSPFDTNSALYKALNYTNALAPMLDNDSHSVLEGIIDFQDGNTGYTTSGNLTQTGLEEINWVGSSATANVLMKFIPARISLESVQIFPNGGMTTAGISSIALKEVYMLNAAPLSYITENAGGLNAFMDKYHTLYAGKDVMAIAVAKGFGQYFSATAEDIVVDPSLHETVSSIPNGTAYPYFYVWENPTTVDNEGVTLLVIECEVTLLGNVTPERRYYTIPFNTVTPTGVIHNKHYHITATIESLGTDNPYDTMKNLGLTVTKPTWVDQNVTVAFE